MKVGRGRGRSASIQKRLGRRRTEAACVSSAVELGQVWFGGVRNV